MNYFISVHSQVLPVCEGVEAVITAILRMKKASTVQASSYNFTYVNPLQHSFVS